MEKPTHTLVATPQMSPDRLADYMAASEQARRRIVQSCKYRSTARVVQHHEARTAIRAAYANGAPDFKALKERGKLIATKLADTDFDAEVNDHNAFYVDHFATHGHELVLPVAEISSGKNYPAFEVNGVRITFRLDLRLQRTTKTNKVRTGGVMLRYQKKRVLAPEVAGFQSAFAFGRLCELTDSLAGEPEKKLCVTVDGWAMTAYEAPTNSVYLYNEIRAACQGIAERWPAIKPPPNAILA